MKQLKKAMVNQLSKHFHIILERKSFQIDWIKRFCHNSMILKNALFTVNIL